MKHWGMAGLCLVCVACTKNAEPRQYKIVEDGAPYEKDERIYDALGQKSLTKGQNYKIVAQDDSGKQPHFLVVNIIKMVGNKKEAVNTGSLFVSDGVATYDCNKMMFDLKATDRDKDIPDVVCKFDVVGVVPISEKATVVKNG